VPQAGEGPVQRLIEALGRCQVHRLPEAGKVQLVGRIEKFVQNAEIAFI